MEKFCTCGARLVMDARFCHRCGRPADGIDPMPVEEPEEDAEPPLPVVTEASAPPLPPPPLLSGSPTPEINFRNGIAVRVCLVAAALVYLLMSVTVRVGGGGLGLMLPLVMTSLGGAYAVFLYRRRSGQPVTVRSGARVGWMTGVFAFVISTVLFTLAVLLVSGQGGMAELYRQSISGMGIPADSAEKVKEMLESPSITAILVVLGLAFQFMTMTVLGSVGGALSAKLLERDS